MFFSRSGANLSSLSTNTASELNILGHDGDSLGVDGTQVGVFEQADQVRLAGLLQGHDGRPLEAEVRLEVLSDLTNQPLEGQFADQQFRALLITTDFTKSHGAGAVSVRFLHPPGGRSRLASSLGGELLTGCLPPSTLTSGLLRTGHSFVSVPMCRRSRNS